ncbi:MAG: phage BR0599 family protein [Gammaproteobacteria bacterium]
MSFNSREFSLDDGAPYRNYQFARGVMRWLYTGADRDQSVGTQVFRAVRGGIADDGIRQTGEASVELLKITAPADLEVASLFRGVPPSGEIALTIFDRHEGESEQSVSWVGSIQSVSWPKREQAQLVCQPLSARMTMQGLRQGWEPACHHALYSVACGVNRDLYRISALIQGITGAAIINGAFAGYPDGYFTAGWVEWPIGSGEYDMRSIERHSGSTLVLLGGTAGLQAGQTLRVFPGCNQTMPICNSRFGNHLNFGGIWHLPGRSPFDGDPVF